MSKTLLEMTSGEVLEAVERRWQELSAQWRTAHRKFKRFRELYYLEHYAGETKIKEGEERVTISDPKDQVDLALGILMGGQDMEIKAFPPPDQLRSAPQLERASQVEIFLHGVLDTNRERFGEDALFLALQNALITGMGILKGVWDRDLERFVGGMEYPSGFGEGVMGESEFELPGAPEGAAELPFPPIPDEAFLQAVQAPPEPLPPPTFEELPLVIRSVDPLHCMGQPGAHKGRWRDFMYAANLSVAAIEQEWGITPKRYVGKSTAVKENTMVRFVDYWKWEQVETLAGTEDILVNVVVADRDIVKPPEAMTNYQHIPYFAFSCYPTDSQDPETAFLSFLYSMQEAVKDQETILNRFYRIVKIFATTPVLADRGRGEPIKVDTSLGTAIHYSSELGQNVKFLEWPGAPTDLYRLIQMNDRRIQNAGFSRIQYGESPAGGGSGYMVSLLTESGRVRLTQPKKQFELAAQLLFQHLETLAANFAPNVAMQVYAPYYGQEYVMTLTGEDLRGHRIRVELKPKYPQDEYRMMVLGAQLMAQKTLSERTIMEKFFGIQQPEEELRNKMREMAIMDPTLRQAQIMKLLVEEGLLTPEQVGEMFGQAQRGQRAKRYQEPRPKLGVPQGMGMPTQVAPATEQGLVEPQEFGIAPPGQEAEPGGALPAEAAYRRLMEE